MHHAEMQLTIHRLQTLRGLPFGTEWAENNQQRRGLNFDNIPSHFRTDISKPMGHVAFLSLKNKFLISRQ